MGQLPRHDCSLQHGAKQLSWENWGGSTPTEREKWRASECSRLRLGVDDDAKNPLRFGARAKDRHSESEHSDGHGEIASAERWDASSPIILRQRPSWQPFLPTRPGFMCAFRTLSGCHSAGPRTDQSCQARFCEICSLPSFSVTAPR
jgi:hypothetical protein